MYEKLRKKCKLMKGKGYDILLYGYFNLFVLYYWYCCILIYMFFFLLYDVVIIELLYLVKWNKCVYVYI